MTTIECVVPTRTNRLGYVNASHLSVSEKTILIGKITVID